MDLRLLGNGHVVWSSLSAMNTVRIKVNYCGDESYRSIQPDAIHTVPARHVGKDHGISFFQALQDLYLVHGCTADLDGDERGIVSSWVQLEQTDGGVWITKRR